MPSFVSPQVTPQGGAGTLPLSQASSSLSTTGQGRQEPPGEGALGRPSAGPGFSSGSGCLWASRLSLGMRKAGGMDGRGQPHPSLPEQLGSPLLCDLL